MIPEYPFVLINDPIVVTYGKLTLDYVDGFMPSKIDTPDDPVFIDKLLSFFYSKKDSNL